MSQPNAPRTGLDADLLRQITGTRTRSTSATMRQVLYALIPGAVLQAWLIDARVIQNLMLGIGMAVLFEACALKLRQRDVLPGVSDGSAALTGALLALSVTPTLPAWQMIIGTAVAILLAKHVFGGLGHNPFNPAMVAFAVLIVSFPADMSHWPDTADPVLSIQSAADSSTSTDTRWDAVTAQTPLDRHREQSRSSDLDTSGAVLDARLFAIAIAWFAGGLWLLWTRVITWHAPLALLGTLALCHGVTSFVSDDAMSPALALLGGASVFGAFFIATDPVSGAATARGRIVFGIGVGVLTYLIRQFGSWPEGFAFAVLIMNGAVPLIDRLERPQRA